MIKRTNLFGAFRKAMMNNPDASRKEAFELFLESMRSDPAYLHDLALNYFDNMVGQWKVDRIGKSHSLVATSAAHRRAEVSAERRTESVARIAKATDELKSRLRAIILLDMTLPNGKKLRDATGAECAKAGGFYTEVSRHLKPTQVVDKHLSEAELRNIQTRFAGGQMKSARKVMTQDRTTLRQLAAL